MPPAAESGVGLRWVLPVCWVRADNDMEAQAPLVLRTRPQDTPPGHAPFPLCCFASFFSGCPSPKFPKRQVQLRQHREVVARTLARQNDCGSSWNVLEAWQLEVRGSFRARWRRVTGGQLGARVGRTGTLAFCPGRGHAEHVSLERFSSFQLVSHWLLRPQANSHPKSWETTGDGRGQTPCPGCAPEAPGQLLGPPCTCRSQPWGGRREPRRGRAPAQHWAEVDPGDPVCAGPSAPSPW